MNACPTNIARRQFFSEDSGFDHPFTQPDWRGCVLDRDKYTNTRLPETLWRALITASGASTIMVCGYYTECERCTHIDSNWGSFSEFMLAQDNYSPEYVIIDESREWAILADVDVTTVGLQLRLADLVDSLLATNKVSLLALTRGDFSDQEILSNGGKYIRGVLGKAAMAQL